MVLRRLLLAASIAVAASFVSAAAAAATTRAPVLVRHPAAATVSTGAYFTWRPTARTSRCRLDLGRWVPCRSPRRYSGLRPGRHRFQIRLTPRGRIASFAWTVRTLPVVALPGPAPAPAPAPAPV